MEGNAVRTLLSQAGKADLPSAKTANNRGRPSAVDTPKETGMGGGRWAKEWWGGTGIEGTGRP